MSRTAEVVFVGDAQSLIRASQQAAAAAEGATGKIEAANKQYMASATAAGEVAAKMAAQTKRSADMQAAAAGDAAKRQAAAVGASAKEQEIAYAKSADAARASAIRADAAAGVHINAASKVKGAFKTLAGSMGVQVGAAGLTAAAVASDKLAIAFEKSMTEIQTQAGASAREVKKMSLAIEDMKGVQQGPLDLAKALFQIESVGFRGAEALKALRASSDVAAVGNANVVTTAGSLVSVLKSYHLAASSATKITADMNAIVGGGRMHMQDLATAMSGGIIPVAAAAGISFKSLGAAIDTLTIGGYTAEKGTNLLRTALFKMAAPTKAATDALKEIHLTHDSLAATMRGPRGLVGGVELLAKHMQGLSKIQQVDLLSKVFSSRSAAVIVTLEGNLHTLQDRLKAIQTQGTTAHFGQDVAAQAHTAAGKIANSISEIEKDASKLGKGLPSVEALFTSAAAKLLNIIVTLPPKIKSALQGPVFDWLLKTSKHVLGDVVHVFKGGFETLEGVADTFAGLFTLNFKEMWKGVQKIFGGAAQALVGALEGMTEPFQSAAKTAFQGIEEAAQSMVNFVIDRLNEMIHAANQAAGKLTFGLSPAIPSIGKLSGAGESGGTEQQAHANPGQVRSDVGGGIMGYFMSKGLSAAQAAGIVGNLQQESGLNPTAAGGGLDQGQGGRLHGGSVQQQLDAMWKELETTEKATLVALKAAKSPQEAARIFSERFERPETPKLSNRERYAAEAYGAHPQAHHPQAHHSHRSHGHSAPEYGPETLPETAAHKAAKHKAKGETGPSPAMIDRWAEQSVGKFAESWGKNTGPELDKLQSEFHTHAAAWCAEFATTAAMMGGANKAVRTASVAMIREWAQQGSHGYKKGISHTPHVGDMMMFGNSHVGFVQSVHGDKVTTIEGNTSAGKVSIGHRSASEGEYASPIYHNLKTGKVLLERASKAYAEAVKKAEHLLLTAGQKATVRHQLAAAKAADSLAGGFAAQAADIGTTMSALTARWAATPQNIATPTGAANKMQRDELVSWNDKAKKKYYQLELKALQKKAKEWGKLRDSYRKFARHTDAPHAKKEALDKAAAFEAKVDQAKAAAIELKGTIYATETEIIEAEGVVAADPAEAAAAAAEAAANVLSGDLNSYEAANAKIEAEQRAKILTPEQAKAAKEANAQKALRGGYGALSEEAILKIKGDAIEFGEALTSATSATEAYTNTVKEAAKALTEFTNAGNNISRVEAGSLAKST